MFAVPDFSRHTTIEIVVMFKKLEDQLAQQIMEIEEHNRKIAEKQAENPNMTPNPNNNHIQSSHANITNHYPQQ